MILYFITSEKGHKEKYGLFYTSKVFFFFFLTKMLDLAFTYLESSLKLQLSL